MGGDGLSRLPDGAAPGYNSSVMRRLRSLAIQTIKFVHWQNGDAFLGYLLDYPDYWTQGDSLNDLKDHLIDLYRDLTR